MAPKNHQPQASVVLPTHNRREMLLRCLEALERQSFDLGAFEVVVAIDGSRDGTAEALRDLETALRLKPLALGAVGQSAARNAALEASEAPLCILIDDDVLAWPSLVAEHVAAHAEGERITGIGVLEQPPPAGRDWYAHAYARAWARHYARLEREPARWSDVYGGNLSAPRQALLEIGGFATDVSVSKDFEIGYRLEQHGYAPRYLPRAGAVHEDRKACARLLAGVRNEGSGYVDLASLHPEMERKLLGWFAEATPRELALRRLLIALRVPPGAVAAAGAAIPAHRGQEVWYEFTRKYAFWLAVRKRVDRSAWRRITAASASAPRTEEAG